MPPQQTNVTAGAASEAARLRFDLSIFYGLIKRSWRAYQSLRQGSAIRLHELSDRQLMDIGLTRGEVDSITPDRAVDRIRDRAADLWNRGGM